MTRQSASLPIARGTEQAFPNPLQPRIRSTPLRDEVVHKQQSVFGVGRRAVRAHWRSMRRRELPRPATPRLQFDHRPIAYRLLTKGFEVRSVSSVALARIREARYGNWDKNDPKDAQVILYMLEQGPVQNYHDRLFNGTHDIQELANTYFHITLARTRLQHTLLLHYLPLYFPEFARYWVATRSAWFVRFLLRFPTPATVRSLDFATFSREAWDLLGRKVSKTAKVAEIYAMDAESITHPVAADSPSIEMFRLQLTRYHALNEQRQELDTGAQQLLSGNGDFQRLQTLPGIGAVMALAILSEAGDLRCFDHRRQFLKYCGL